MNALSPKNISLPSAVISSAKHDDNDTERFPLPFGRGEGQGEG